jgi:type IV pilus assembly protein PilC
VGHFIYEAVNRSGELKKGEIEAKNLEDARGRLTSSGFRVRELHRRPFTIKLKMPGSEKVSTKELVVFTRQFATMINAGLPLVQCLDLLGSQMDNLFFKVSVLDVKTQVEGGKTLAEAMRRHPKVFDRLYANLVAAGEASGVLDRILERLSGYLEKNAKLAKQIRGAMVYPALVLGVSLIVTLVLLVFVIPVFKKMFEEFGSELPGLTKWVMSVSETVQHDIFYILAGFAAIRYGIRYVLNTKGGRETFDRAALTLPGIGQLVRKIAVAKFTRTMGTMLASGVNIMDALDIVAGTAGNVVIEEGLLGVRSKIAEGKPMAPALGEMKVFPSMVVQMIAVGESTGALDSMLNKVADFYDDEVDGAVGTLLAMLEPLIMSFLAVLLGGLVISMYLPIFSLAGASNK